VDRFAAEARRPEPAEAGPGAGPGFWPAFADGAGPVPPGGGWPDDPAGPGTPVAVDAAGVLRLAAGAPACPALDAAVSVCRACPRLVQWREDVAAERRRAYAGERYWGRPVPSWGPPDAAVLLLGLAPAAHGGNRTGRIFTGDRSGDWLFAALHRAGLAELPTSRYAGDGQRLIGTRVAAAVRCAPPANKPTPGERDTCRPWLVRELELLRPTLRAVVTLGAFAWQALWPALSAAGYPVPSRRPAFGHGAAVVLPLATPDGAGGAGGAGGPQRPVEVLGCYHPSQQNTFTGRVTEAMLEDVLSRAAALAREA
jgi:uracil-DNA glycosylase family 4